MKVKSPCLKELVNAFFNNIARTDSFCLFPAEIAATALQNQFWRDYAVFKVTGKLTPNEQRRFNEKIETEIAKEIEKRKKAWKKKFFSAGMNAADKRRMTVGVGHVNRMLESEIGADQSMNNILFSVVVESWTAFETLSADLWYAALDNGAAEWRKRAGLKADKSKGGDFEPSDSFDFNKIADPQKNYGSYLRDTEKATFQKLHLIKDWYKTVFGKKVQQKLFASDAYINALSAIRNVITHKAGIADRKYVEAVKTFPKLNTVVQNEPIRLDGGIVRELRNAAIRVGNELVTFVDGQLINRTKP